MILDGIDVFVRVVQAGGFSSAARQLRMPATTVSAKIARLEERLGVTLIRRSTRKMHVTDAGQAYFTHCVEALRALEIGEEQLSAATEGPRGALRITAPPDLAQSVLPPIVDRFLARYPQVNIDLVITNQTLDLLADRIDIALRASPMKDSSLQSRKLGVANLALFASKAYLRAHGTPRAPDDLKHHEVMVHSRFPSALLTLHSGNKSLRIAPSPRVTSDDMQTLRALAMEGTAIALLPDLDGGGGDLVRVLRGYATQSGAAYFVYPSGKFTPTNVRAFIDLTIETRQRSG